MASMGTKRKHWAGSGQQAFVHEVGSGVFGKSSGAAHVFDCDPAGTGEHTIYNAAALPGLQWQPTDADPAALASIEAWRRSTAVLVSGCLPCHPWRF